MSIQKAWYQRHPLRWGIFNAWDSQFDFDLPWARTFWAVAIGPVAGFGGAAIGAVVSAWLIIPVFLAALLLSWFAPTWGKMHPLGKVPRYVLGPDSRTRENPLRDVAERYWDLPDEDKREFPTNIMDVMSDSDLERDQRRALADSMQKTLRKIEERNRAQRQLSRRNVDVSAVLQYMEEQRDSLNETIKTYKEFS